MNKTENQHQKTTSKNTTGYAFEVVAYRAPDGKLFESKEECEAYIENSKIDDIIDSIQYDDETGKGSFIYLIDLLGDVDKYGAEEVIRVVNREYYGGTH